MWVQSAKWRGVVEGEREREGLWIFCNRYSYFKFAIPLNVEICGKHVAWENLWQIPCDLTVRPLPKANNCPK